MLSQEEQVAAPRGWLFKSATRVVSMTFISRVLGLVREVILAHSFGPGVGLDAFFVAFKIPNFFRRLSAEGAFSQAFVPVLSEYKQCRTEQEVKTFLNYMAGTLGGFLILITVVAVIASPLVISVFAPGFLHGSARFILATEMLRLTFPYLLLISLTAFAGAILNTYGSFTVPAFTPVFLNICMILAALYLSPYMSISVMALAWGVLVAGVVQLLFQLPFLKKKNLLPKPKFKYSDPGVKKVLKLMVPAIFGVSVAQVNLLIDTIFASFLITGSVSWLYFSERLMDFPLGVFGVAVATVILPTLAQTFSRQQHDDFQRTLDWAIRSILIVAIPSAVSLLLLAGPMLTTMFSYGKFSAHDVLMSRQSLIAYAIGLPAFMLVKVLASGFYAKQNLKTPVKIAIASMLANTIMNFIFIGYLKHAGLALATSLAAILNAGLLLYMLLRNGSYHFEKGWLRYLFQLFVANIILVLILYWQMGTLDNWAAWHCAARVIHLFSLVIIGITVYCISLWALGVRPKDFRKH